MSIVQTEGLPEQQQSPYPPGWLVGQLPVGMRDDDLLVRLTTIFERVGATLRAGADATELVADHRVTSAAMLQYLSTWTGLQVLDPELPVLRQRAVVRAISRSVPHRGTVAALRTLLEAITEAPVDIIEPGGVFREGEAPAHEGRIEVRVRSTGHLTSDELVALVRDEVPAHLALRLVVLGEGGSRPAADLTGGPGGPGGDGDDSDDGDDVTMKELP
jgi:phage tail-like protein